MRKKCSCTENVVAEECYQSSYGVDTCTCDCHKEPEKTAFNEWVSEKMKQGKITQKEWVKINSPKYQSLKIKGELYKSLLFIKDEIVEGYSENRKDAIYSAYLDYLRQ